MAPISIVIPDGSMQETVMGFMAKAGLPVTIEKKRSDEGKVNVPWISGVAFQRPKEIPYYLERNHFDVAIVGEDWLADGGYSFPVLLTLPIGRGGNKPVRIVLAVHKNSGFRRAEDLPPGCEVATEYEKLTARYFLAKGRQDIVVMPSAGKTESKIRRGTTAIVDVTESGLSLEMHHLIAIDEIMVSNTVLVANHDSYKDEGKKPYIDCFARLIKGAYQASQYVFMIANVPTQVLEKAIRILGGLKSPSRSTICQGWLALQSIVSKDEELDKIFKLQQIGVTDIIVIRDIPLIMT